MLWTRDDVRSIDRHNSRAFRVFTNQASLCNDCVRSPPKASWVAEAVEVDNAAGNQPRPHLRKPSRRSGDRARLLGGYVPRAEGMRLRWLADDRSLWPRPAGASRRHAYLARPVRFGGGCRGTGPRL